MADIEATKFIEHVSVLLRLLLGWLVHHAAAHRIRLQEVGREAALLLLLLAHEELLLLESHLLLLLRGREWPHLLLGLPQTKLLHHLDLLLGPRRLQLPLMQRKVGSAWRPNVRWSHHPSSELLLLEMMIRRQCPLRWRLDGVLTSTAELLRWPAKRSSYIGSTSP